VLCTVLPLYYACAGVAPDHPEVKLVQNDFDKILCDDRVEFFGNVSVGSSLLPVTQLQKHYSAVILVSEIVCISHVSMSILAFYFIYFNVFGACYHV
jgi:hypothetical protein